jgi:hypothetical protein
MASAYWVCLLVTSISAFTSFGFSIGALLSSTDRARINAMYASGRSVALAVASVGPIFAHSNTRLVTIAVIMIIVQALDSVVGVVTRQRMKTYGPAALALLNSIALLWLLE